MQFHFLLPNTHGRPSVGWTDCFQSGAEPKEDKRQSGVWVKSEFVHNTKFIVQHTLCDTVV